MKRWQVSSVTHSSFCINTCITVFILWEWLTAGISHWCNFVPGHRSELMTISADSKGMSIGTFLGPVSVALSTCHMMTIFFINRSRVSTIWRPDFTCKADGRAGTCPCSAISQPTEERWLPSTLSPLHWGDSLSLKSMSHTDANTLCQHTELARSKPEPEAVWLWLVWCCVCGNKHSAGAGWLSVPVLITSRAKLSACKWPCWYTLRQWDWDTFRSFLGAVIDAELLCHSGETFLQPG